MQLHAEKISSVIRDISNTPKNRVNVSELWDNARADFEGTCRRANALFASALTALVALTGCSPPKECDLEVEVDGREFDVECEFDEHEGEYDCVCEGDNLPKSLEPPSCQDQCDGDSDCLQRCSDSGDEQEDCVGDCGPIFSEDFEDDSFCTQDDLEQERIAIDACGLN